MFNKIYAISFLIFSLFTLNIQSQNLLNWYPIEEVNSTLPNEVQLYKATGRIDGDTITAYYSISDISTGRCVLYPLYAEINQKPEAYIDSNNDDILIMTNGGYFGTNVSYSLVISNRITLIPNIRALTRSYSGQNYTYYPTRSAFGVMPNLDMEAAYIYSLQENNFTYAYPQASPNSTDSLPLPQPSPFFPEGGKIWNVTEAIGGGPMLIRDSTINFDYTPELFYSDITNSQAPRTAIGCTGDGKIINLVVDGRQSHSLGVTLQNLSEILLELGCVEAINLDGGGSSTMLALNEIINEPSDGTTRSIPTVVAIKKANSFDTDNESNFCISSEPFDTNHNESFGESGSLLFEYGNAGIFKLPDLKPALYRLEAYINRNETLLSDSVIYSISYKASIPDTVVLNQSDCTHGFNFLGNFHLYQDDSIIIANHSINKFASIDAIRLIKTGSSIPVIKLEGNNYAGEHATREIINFEYSITSQTELRPVNRIKVIENYNGMSKTLQNKIIDPVNNYSDSISYEVLAENGPIIISFIVFDTFQDSSMVQYTIDIVNSNPKIVFGINSVLQGNIGDTLVFHLRMTAANDNRSLKRLLVQTFQNEILTTTDSFEISGSLVNFYYMHKIKQEDINNLSFDFKVTDIYNYSSNIGFFLEGTSINEKVKNSPHFLYNSNSQRLQYYENSIESNKIHKLYIYDILHLVKQHDFRGSSAQIDISSFKEGVYFALVIIGNDVFTYKFYKN